MTDYDFISFFHIDGLYIISDIPLLDYNIWYNFVYYSKHTRLERKETYGSIISVINIEDLSNIIFDYIFDHYVFKLHILKYDNEISRIVYKYDVNTENYFDLDELMDADYEDYVEQKKSFIRLNELSIERDLSIIDYCAPLAEIEKKLNKIEYRDIPMCRNTLAGIKFTTDMIFKQCNIDLNMDTTDRYAEMRIQENNFNSLLSKEYLYVHTYDKISGLTKFTQGEQKYVKQYEYGNDAELREFLKELSMTIHKKLK